MVIINTAIPVTVMLLNMPKVLCTERTYLLAHKI